MTGEVDLSEIDWEEIGDQVATRGWARLVRAVPADALAALNDAAPAAWSVLAQTEGSAGVRQGGLSTHCAVDDAPLVVRSLARAITSGLDGARGPSAPMLPGFNHAQWGRASNGEKFITAHRDPDTAGGVIAVLTIRGRAVFRVWDLDGPLAQAERNPERATMWETEDGDLVVLRGGGWPSPSSRCPIHEAESPPDGERVTLTLRHNKGGYGTDYFS